MASNRLGWGAALVLLVGCPGGDDAETSGQQSTSTTNDQTQDTADTIPLPTATDSSGGPPDTTTDEGTTSTGSSSTGADGTGSSSGEAGESSSSGEGSSSSGEGSGYDVSWCILQYPPMVSVMTDEAFTVYIRLYAAGLTDLTGTNDPDPLLVVELGYGLDGSDPSLGLGAPWTYLPADPNPGYGPGAPGYGPDNDEYWGELSIPMAGIYDFAGRVSGDGGMTWVYCDLDGLTMGGYTPAQAGHAEVGP